MALNITKIKYLSFEGGGGKGNAYMGAIYALEKNKILKNIVGYSGTSAGAIMSLLLSCEFNYWEIREKFTDSEKPSIHKMIKKLDSEIPTDYKLKRQNQQTAKINFNKFFDSPLVGERMTLKGIVCDGKDKLTEQKPFSPVKPMVLGEIIGLASDSTDLLASTLESDAIFNSFFNKYKSKLFGLQIDNKTLYNRLFSDPKVTKQYIKCLTRDFGLFSGANIYHLFNSIILEAILKKKNKGEKAAIEEKTHEKYNWPEISKQEKDERTGTPLKDEITGTPFILNGPQISFKEHWDIFGKELIVTSVNLKTSQLQIFSHKHTPDLPVALGIRMSMSLPLIFKPVLIETDKNQKKPAKNDFLDGVWIDGGVLDNAPVRVFDPGTALLFRLGSRVENNKIDSISDFLLAWLKMGLAGAGSSIITESTFDSDYIIELSIKGADTLKFDIDKEAFERLEFDNMVITLSKLEKFMKGIKSRKKAKPRLGDFEPRYNRV